MRTPPSHARLIAQLAADSAPVHRLWPARTRLALWLALDVAVVAIVVGLSPRPDLTSQLARPGFVLQVVALLGAAGALAALALRGAVPGSGPTAAARGTAVVLIATALALLALEPIHRVSPQEFLARGAFCFVSTLLLAIVPWLALWIAVRRGTPLQLRRVGAEIGGAALLVAVAATRVSCPIEDALHVLAAHALPVAVGALLSGMAGTMWLGRWAVAASSSPAR